MSAQEDHVHAGVRKISGLAPPESFLRAVEPFEDELAELRPDGVHLCDVHTHLGLDEDGRSLDLENLLAQLDQGGVRNGCVFPLHDPDRSPAYRVPNDRVLEWASESDGRLTPFARLDPSESPIEEGERALNAGAQGLKLHPRAQAFGFDVDGIDAIFGLAADAKVPLLIHMGRGMPPVADGLVQVAERNPEARLVLAHAGIADQNVLAHRLNGHPGVFYDTSCFSAWDVLELFARTPAERICFGSDPPYGRPFAGLYLALRAAQAAGCSPEQVAGIGGRNAAALVARGELPGPTAPVAPRIRPVPGVLPRITTYCSMAFGSVFAGTPATGAEMLELAVAACRDPDPEPPELGVSLERLGRTLSTAAALLRDPDTAWFGTGLIHLSQSFAATGG